MNWDLIKPYEDFDVPISGVHALGCDVIPPCARWQPPQAWILQIPHSGRARWSFSAIR